LAGDWKKGKETVKEGGHRGGDEIGGVDAAITTGEGRLMETDVSDVETEEGVKQDDGDGWMEDGRMELIEELLGGSKEIKLSTGQSQREPGAGHPR
jgi:hypothetical protein